MIEALGFSINLTVIILSKIRNNLCLYSHLKVCLQEKIPTCNNLKTCIILKNCVAQDSIPRIVVIFPTKNEEDTIEHVIRTAKKSQHNPENS
jgi:hypothetical protein